MNKVEQKRNFIESERLINHKHKWFYTIKYAFAHLGSSIFRAVIKIVSKCPILFVEPNCFFNRQKLKEICF